MRRRWGFGGGGAERYKVRETFGSDGSAPLAVRV
jgi:hypothetical protein